MSSMINFLAMPAFLGDFWEKLKYQVDVTLIQDDYWKEYMKGLGMTVFLALMAIIFGTIIGTFVANVIRFSKDTGKAKIFAKICNIYVQVVRGTPVMVQLFIMYYIVFTSTRNATFIAVITFSLNSGAYVSEVVRGGIDSVDKGQMEAGRSLGLSRKKTMRKIIMPQAVKNIIPALGNEFASLIKETSVVGFIALMDLTYAQSIRSARYQVFEFPLFFIAAIYLILVLGTGKLMNILEKRMNRSDKGN